MSKDIKIAEALSLPEDDLDIIGESLQDITPELRGSHIFITGGTGFFGIWLLESLLWMSRKYDLNLNVSILSRNPALFLERRGAHFQGWGNVSFVQGTLSNFAIPEKRITHIIHAASESNLSNSSNWAESHLFSALDGMRRIIELSKHHQIKSMLVTSSGAAYNSLGYLDNGRWIEGLNGLEDYMSEGVVYGQTKRMTELMASMGAKSNNFKVSFARCFCFVGPYLPLNANYAIGNFINNLLNNQDILVQGDGSPVRSYLYTSDLVIWLLTILIKGRNGVPYNVGGERSLSIAQLAKIIASYSNSNLNVVIKKPPLGLINRPYLPDLSRSFEELGLRIHTGLEDSISKTIAWHRISGEV